jgi:hypothetical protein
MGTPPIPPSPTPTPKSQEPTTVETASMEAKKEWAPQKLKGFQLFMLFASITLVTFVALLDTSILGTVRSHPHGFTPNLDTY